MKPKKTCDVQRVTELGENILKAQNTMLAAKVDELKKELLNLKSVDTEYIYIVSSFQKIETQSLSIPRNYPNRKNYVISFLEEFES